MTDRKIARVEGFELMDSRGNPTVGLLLMTGAQALRFLPQARPQAFTRRTKCVTATKAATEARGF